MTDAFAAVEIEDLPDDFREIAEMIGLDAALDLVRSAGGSQIYVPKAETITRGARDRNILAAWERTRDYSLVARIHGLTENHVRAIIRHLTGAERHKARQVDLF